MIDGHTEAVRIWRLNFLLSTATLSAAGEELKALGLVGKEFFVLDGIEDHPSPAGLAESLSMSKPNLTMHLKALQARGLIDRSVDQADLRRHRLVLSDLGRELRDKARGIVTAKYEDTLQKLSAPERQNFMRLLERLVLD